MIWLSMSGSLSSHALEEAIKQELTEFLGYEQYQRGNGKRGNNRSGYYERDLLIRFGMIEDIQVSRGPQR
ncbi:MAG TPA: hypothetical protein GXX40_10120 [Firmicutes bacterium]|nr:hypothetical protein [Bacillota bacterium]